MLSSILKRPRRGGVWKWGGKNKVPVTEKGLQLAGMGIIKQQGKGGTSKCSCASVGRLKSEMESRHVGCQMTPW